MTIGVILLQIYLYIIDSISNLLISINKTTWETILLIILLIFSYMVIKRLNIFPEDKK